MGRDAWPLHLELEDLADLEDLEGLEDQMQSKLRTSLLYPTRFPQPHLRYLFRTHRPGARLTHTSVQALLTFRVPPQCIYGEDVQRAIDQVWQLLPQRWKEASAFFLKYSFHPDNPKLQMAGTCNVAKYSVR